MAFVKAFSYVTNIPRTDSAWNAPEEQGVGVLESSMQAADAGIMYYFLGESDVIAAPEGSSLAAGGNASVPIVG